MFNDQKRRQIIYRLRDDSRTRALMRLWVGHAMSEAEANNVQNNAPHVFACTVATLAVELAMAHMVENDGELAAMREIIDKLQSALLESVGLVPPALPVLPAPHN